MRKVIKIDVGNMTAKECDKLLSLINKNYYKNDFNFFLEMLGIAFSITTIDI